MQVGQSKRDLCLLAIYLGGNVTYFSPHDEHSKRLVVYSLNSRVRTSFPFEILLNSFEDSSLRRDVLEAVHVSMLAILTPMFF